MPNESVRQLYIDELRDLYNAETQLVKALPKMAKASSNDELRQAFEEHLRQTSEHVSRLEQIFEMLDEKPTGKKCLGMDGLVKEAAETMKEDYEVQSPTTWRSIVLGISPRTWQTLQAAILRRSPSPHGTFRSIGVVRW